MIQLLRRFNVNKPETVVVNRQFRFIQSDHDEIRKIWDERIRVYRMFLQFHDKTQDVAFDDAEPVCQSHAENDAAGNCVIAQQCRLCDERRILEVYRAHHKLREAGHRVFLRRFNALDVNHVLNSFAMFRKNGDLRVNHRRCGDNFVKCLNLRNTFRSLSKKLAAVQHQHDVCLIREEAFFKAVLNAVEHGNRQNHGCHAECNTTDGNDTDERDKRLLSPRTEVS